MQINTNYFISLWWGKNKAGFINHIITNKITGLVKGNYINLPHYCEVSELPKRSLIIIPRDEELSMFTWKSSHLKSLHLHVHIWRV